MRRLVSKRWIKPVLALLGAGAALVIFLAGYWHAAPATQVVHTPARARISPTATYEQVVANFGGRPYVSGQLPELPGFTCEGWTNGASGHGWIVLRCSK